MEQEKKLHPNQTPTPVLGRIPVRGFIWNPLKSMPRNSPCPCGSGKKFKKCHLNVLPDVVPSKESLEETMLNEMKEKADKVYEYR